MSRGEPVVKVFCDRCDEPEEFAMTPLAGGCWDCRGLGAQMGRSRWVKVGVEDVCPLCSERDGEEEQ